MAGDKNPRKGLKICCLVTTAILVLLIVICVTLYFTVFKPKQPTITPHPATLANAKFQFFPLSINVTVGLNVTIDNPNYGGFRFKNATTYVSYHDTRVAEIPIAGETIPARGKIDISAYANVTADKLVESPSFWSDLVAGSFNMTAVTLLHGKVRFLKVLKIGAAVSSTCDISVFVQPMNILTKCYSKIKL